MSPILFWILIALFAVNAMTTIIMIGKPRTPTTPGIALISALINVALIVSLFIWGR